MTLPTSVAEAFLPVPNRDAWKKYLKVQAYKVKEFVDLAGDDEPLDLTLIVGGYHPGFHTPRPSITNNTYDGDNTVQKQDTPHDHGERVQDDRVPATCQVNLSNTSTAKPVYISARMANGKKFAEKIAYGVSAKKLMAASPKWKAFLEASAAMSSHDNLFVIEYPFKHPMALPVFLAAVHGRDDCMPLQIDMELMCEVALFTREFDCLPVLASHIERWVPVLYTYHRSYPKDRELFTWQWLWVAHEFGFDNMFSSSTLQAIASNWNMSKFSPKLPDDILGRLDKCQNFFIEKFLEKVAPYVLQLADELECNFNPGELPLCARKSKTCLGEQKKIIIALFRRVGLAARGQDWNTIVAAVEKRDASQLNFTGYNRLFNDATANIFDEHDGGVEAWGELCHNYKGPQTATAPRCLTPRNGSVEIPTPHSVEDLLDDRAFEDRMAQRNGTKSECGIIRFARAWDEKRRDIVDVTLCLYPDRSKPMTNKHLEYMRNQHRVIRMHSASKKRDHAEFVGDDFDDDWQIQF